MIAIGASILGFAWAPAIGEGGLMAFGSWLVAFRDCRFGDVPPTFTHPDPLGNLISIV